jgi:hypothetical protein
MLWFGVALFRLAESVFELPMEDFDPSQYLEADRREVDPPVEVQVATWSVAGQLHWWVTERREWLGRVRGSDGRQRWIKAADPSPGESGLSWLSRFRDEVAVG